MSRLVPASWSQCLALAALFSLSCAPDEGTEGEGEDGGDDAVLAQADDADGDGISDQVEGQVDSDGDGTVDAMDADSDDDCIPDSIERGPGEAYSLPLDSDVDGVADYLDLDSDGNGLGDQEEVGTCDAPADLDDDDLGNWRDLDDDGDGLSDLVEGLTDPDGDSVGSYRDLDSDGDCVPDAVEAGVSEADEDPRDTDADGTPDYLDLDSDADGLPDGEEAGGACEEMADTDTDGTPDYIDHDIDGDGLSNLDEAVLLTDPLSRDSDGDGFTDGLEDFAGTDPLDDDRQPEGILLETGPRQVVEYEDEYVLDEYKTDIFVLLDTAYSYSCYHPDLESFIEQLVERLFEEFEDVGIGFGTYDDYRYGNNWAAANGHPFKLQHQVSTDAESVVDAAHGQEMIYGGDALGSAYEALFQAATGQGFDQVCDQAFTNNVDVKPFEHGPDDAFGGAVVGTRDETTEGSGDRGGVGFRSGSSPIFLLASDNTIRNGELGHEMPVDTCGDPASFSQAVAAIGELGGRVLGMNVYEYQSSDDTLQGQLIELAQATNSFIDTDGDGVKDDPAVLFGSWNWPELDDIIAALWQMVEDMELELSFQLLDDERGWISEFHPEGETFTIERGSSLGWGFVLSTAAQTQPDDQFYHAKVEVHDQGQAFDEQDIWVLIRPEFVP